jgi:hypothetical protein
LIVPPASSSSFAVNREEAIAAFTRLDALAEPRLSRAALAAWPEGATRVELGLADEPGKVHDFIEAVTVGTGRVVLPIGPVLRMFGQMSSARIRIEQDGARAPIRITDPNDELLVALVAPVQTHNATKEEAA